MLHFTRTLGAVVVALVALLSQLPTGTAVSNSMFYPYGDDNGDAVLQPGDDVSSDEIALEENIVFYNTSYNSIYVNMNGHVTFGSEMPGYRVDRPIPYEMDIGIIAVFLADVDTTRAGKLQYRSTTDSAMLGRAAADIRAYFTNYENFSPTMLFMATWNQVGYYNAQFDKTNTFQLILVTDGRDSFAIFNYDEQGMEWMTSQGKFVPTKNDLPPQAGFDKGDGKRHFTLMGSAKTGEFVSGTNVQMPGTWMYQIGNFETGDVRPADLNTGGVTLFEVESQNNCFGSTSNCHENAQCIDYKDGYCCRCLPPWYGNGKTCLAPGVPQQANGRITGRVNGIELDNQQQIHTYVVTKDGRSYSALSRIPDSLLSAFQTLTSIGGIVGWLYAVRVNPMARNGFVFTGGKLNRTARVTFQGQDGQQYVLRVNQVFHGHDTHDQIRMDTYLDGTVPDIPKGVDIKVDDYHENLKKTAPGIIKSFSARTYRVNGVAYRYTWDNTITFEECGDEMERALGDVMRLGVSRHFIYLAPEKNTVRYSLVSKMGVFAGADPCADSTGVCSDKADCVHDGASYKCVCMAGYLGDGVNCQDVNECDTNPCDLNAECFNVEGNFQCRCRPGYEGDGKVCRASRTCGPYQCDVNARCVGDADTREYTCECVRGYQGDGVRCTPSGQLSCNEADICSANAECVYDEDLREYVCECQDEFSGDGYTGCEALIGLESCDECDRYAECLLDESINRYMCQCRPGFTGDGRTCSIIEECRDCDRYAQCVFDEVARDYTCVCVRGYKGDGKTCEIRDCREDESMCDPDGGICWFDENRNISICRCNYGYRGTGFRCERVGCDVYDDCDDNAQCINNGYLHQCTCNDGYVGDGKRCRLDDGREQGCNVANDCDGNARCVQLADRSYACRCNPGYGGDGKTCERQEQGCNVANDCDGNARCVQLADRSYACRCNPGYGGDGKTCERQEQGCNVVNDCDDNARCIQEADGRYACRCTSGYRGDGRTCRAVEVPCNQVNNCDRHAECLYNPDSKVYQCRCSRGYEGNGLQCQRREVIDCRRDPRLCGRSAECVQGSEDAYVCVCQPGYRGDGASCSRVVQEGNHLVYAQGNKIMRISADGDANDYGQILAYEPGMLAVGVEIDCQEGDIYWTDAAKGVIKRSRSNGSDVENLVNGMKSPEGIAIDFVARNMFFTDSEMDSLHVSKLNGTNVKTLVSSDMVNPRAIVLDVNRGVIYWTDWNRNRPQIERINMDGTNRSVLVTDDLSLPNGLAFDPYSQTLCWGDAGTKRIECMRSDGAGRRVVYGQASYPFDIALLNNVIYWTDWRMREIPFVNQNGGDTSQVLRQAMGGHGRTYGIAAIKDSCPRARNSCGLNNGGCKFLCLPTGRGGRTCECPDGMDPRACMN